MALLVAVQCGLREHLEAIPRCRQAMPCTQAVAQWLAIGILTVQIQTLGALVSAEMSDLLTLVVEGETLPDQVHREGDLWQGVQHCGLGSQHVTGTPGGRVKVES